nr:MAG TPA: hypothetical protein [Caudoviricetes sp.]
MGFMIDRSKFKTELGRVLYDRLKNIWDDADFIGGVLVSVKGDEKKKKLMRYLDAGETDTDRILELAAEINKGK